MLKVSNIVRDIVYSSEIALTALSSGYLNLSGYAKSIKEEVENKTKKRVRIGSVVVALSRLNKERKKTKPLLPEVVAEDISIKSGLVEIVFDKTKDNMRKLQSFYKDSELTSGEFFMITQGIGEITLITLEDVKDRIIRTYQPQRPKKIINNLVGLTIHLKEQYISTPNVIYALVRSLRIKRINIVEIVSTFTELTFIVDRRDLQEAFLTLNEILKKSS